MELEPSVLFAARTPVSAGWRWENPDRHRTCLNLWLIVDGRGQWQGEGRTHQLSPGDCFVQRLWHPSVGTTDPDHPLVVLWANLSLRRPDGSTVDLSTLPDQQLPVVHRRVADLGLVASMAQRMIDRFEVSGTGAATDRWLACIWEEIGRGDQELSTDGRLAALIADIRARPEQPWRVARLAQQLDLPVDRFTRYFRGHVGISPREFVMRARLDAAKAMLRMSNLNVGHIAEQLNFCDIYHFSRRFRQHVGSSPSAYRSGA